MLRIYGASDDLVELEGIGEMVRKCSECGREHDEPSQAVVGEGSEEVGSDEVKLTIGDAKGGVVVAMHYTKAVISGCWSAEVSQIDEDVPIPWPVSVSHGKPTNYSVVVFVDAPDGTPVKWETL